MGAKRCALWRLLALAIACIAPALRAQEPSSLTILHAGSVLITPGEPPASRQTLVIADGRIVERRDGFVEAAAFGPSARVIDLSDAFVMPGLGEMHIHFASYIGKDKVSASLVPPARRALDAARHARRMLEAGVTLARDTGDVTGITYHLRNAINEGVVPGPRLFLAGRVLSRTGGHGVQAYYMGSVPRPPENLGGCDGVESCRRVVRENVDAGSDLIKITISGSASDEWGRADAQPMLFPDEIGALAEAAHQLGRPIAMHAHSTAGIKAALRAGVTTIEHGTYLDEESARLFRSTGAYLVPSTWISDYINTNLERFRSRNTPRDFEIMKKATADGMSTAVRAWRLGVPIATGTDTACDSDPLATVRELELWVAQGIPAAEAIKGSTMNAAAIVGEAAQLGQLKSGFRADLIAVRGNPLADISALRHVLFVMKDGVVVRSAP